MYFSDLSKGQVIECCPINLDQTTVNEFLDLSGDKQWIHQSEPNLKNMNIHFKEPVIPGFLLLSIIPRFLNQKIKYKYPDLVINAGLNTVRFPHPSYITDSIVASFLVKEIMHFENKIYTLLMCELREPSSKKVVCSCEIRLLLLKGI